MKTKLFVGLTAGALALGSITAYAQMNHGPHMSQGKGPGMMNHAQMQHGSGMHHDPMHGGSHQQHGSQGPGKPKGDTGPSSLAFDAINAKMHEGMDITFSGNADIDFVRGMIPHHQGAVDMAKTVLAFGKDPRIRKLAEDIIKAQESEIAFMQDWLTNNAK